MESRIMEGSGLTHPVVDLRGHVLGQEVADLASEARRGLGDRELESLRGLGARRRNGCRDARATEAVIRDRGPVVRLVAEPGTPRAGAPEVQLGVVLQREAVAPVHLHRVGGDRPCDLPAPPVRGARVAGTCDPTSSAQPTRDARSRAASSAVAWSARRWASAWNAPMRRPNCTRSLQYRTAVSSAPAARPTSRAASSARSSSSTASCDPGTDRPPGERTGGRRGDPAGSREVRRTGAMPARDPTTSCSTHPVSPSGTLPAWSDTNARSATDRNGAATPGVGTIATTAPSAMRASSAGEEPASRRARDHRLDEGDGGERAARRLAHDLRVHERRAGPRRLGRRHGRQSHRRQGPPQRGVEPVAGLDLAHTIGRAVLDHHTRHGVAQGFLVVAELEAHRSLRLGGARALHVIVIQPTATRRLAPRGRRGRQDLGVAFGPVVDLERVHVERAPDEPRDPGTEEDRTRNGPRQAPPPRRRATTASTTAPASSTHGPTRSTASRRSPGYPAAATNVPSSTRASTTSR